MNNEIITTGDGSHSLISSIFQESYHSRHGAIQESRHVFIEAGLQQMAGKKDIYILEAGFGTGLNALLTRLEASRMEIHIHYTTYEAFPIVEPDWVQLNYHQLLSCEQVLLTSLHEVVWDKAISMDPFFTFEKRNQKMESIEEENAYELIFFDAFAPASQPELWGFEMMRKLYAALKPQGILVTYCAQGAFRRNLKEAGFQIEKIQGPPGKREMTRAIK